MTKLAKPTMVPRALKDGSAWYIELTWPDGRSEADRRLPVGVGDRRLDFAKIGCLAESEDGLTKPSGAGRGSRAFRFRTNRHTPLQNP